MIYSLPNSSLKHYIGLSHHLRFGMIWPSPFVNMIRDAVKRKHLEVAEYGHRTSIRPWHHHPIFKVGSKRPPLRLWPRKDVEGFSRLQWVRKCRLSLVTIWWMESHPGILTPKQLQKKELFMQHKCIPPSLATLKGSKRLGWIILHHRR